MVINLHQANDATLIKFKSFVSDVFTAIIVYNTVNFIAIHSNASVGEKFALFLNIDTPAIKICGK